MAQTFRYHISALNWLVVALIIAAAVFFFVDGTLGGAVTGFLLLAVNLFAVERMNTRYTFTDDGLLVVRRGSIVRPLSISVNEILRAESVRGRLLPVSFVLIEYGARHFTSVQTDDEEAFISELKRRQRAFDLTLKDDEKK